MTLIELLVVVAIVVTLLAAAVPMMKPALRDAQIRESSRQLNVFCTIAKGRARELGRPAGVWIERAAAGGNAAFEIHIAEEPAPYSGDFLNAGARLFDVNSDGVIDGQDKNAPPGPDDSVLINKGTSSIALNVIKAGDTIRFNSQGPRYPISSITDPGGADFVIKITVPARVPKPLPTRAPTASPPGQVIRYTVYRQPIKSHLPSLQLSGGSAVDLEYSGIGAPDTLFNAQLTNRPAPEGLNDLPVIIMFDSAGSVERVYKRFVNASGAVAFSGDHANGTIYLLVGRFDQTRPPPDPATPTVMPPTTAEQTNLQDDSTIWVAIGARTGNVSTAENLSAATVAEGRLLARSAQSIGGN
jgi:type II secretory pathway pseudopilin PulG